MITVTVDDQTYVFDVDADLRLDEANLGWEMERIASTHGKYAQVLSRVYILRKEVEQVQSAQQARLKWEYEHAKEMVSRVQAMVRIELLNSSNKKLTVAEQEAHIAIDDRVIDAVNEMQNARLALDVYTHPDYLTIDGLYQSLKNAVDSLEIKKNMIQSLGAMKRSELYQL